MVLRVRHTPTRFLTSLDPTPLHYILRRREAFRCRRSSLQPGFHCLRLLHAQRARRVRCGVREMGVRFEQRRVSVSQASIRFKVGFLPWWGRVDDGASDEGFRGGLAFAHRWFIKSWCSQHTSADQCPISCVPVAAPGGCEERTLWRSQTGQAA